jgi:hypothetical protein
MHWTPVPLKLCRLAARATSFGPGPRRVLLQPIGERTAEQEQSRRRTTVPAEDGGQDNVIKNAPQQRGTELVAPKCLGCFGLLIYRRIRDFCQYPLLLQEFLAVPRRLHSDLILLPTHAESSIAGYLIVLDRLSSGKQTSVKRGGSLCILLRSDQGRGIHRRAAGGHQSCLRRPSRSARRGARI